MTDQFHTLGLHPALIDAITDLGFQSLTPIQEAAIPHLLAGRDVVGIAQTGTGKTAAFGLPLLQAIDFSAPHVQALVLAPTRELAGQTESALASFSKYLPDLRTVVVYGGASYSYQIRALEQGAQVVVGTPGRVMDLIEKGALDLSQVSFFVLDEADEMLRMGFAEDVEKIASHLPQPRRTALFSATMPKAIEKIAAEYLEDPEHIAITPPTTTVESVNQSYAVVPYKFKSVALARVLSVMEADAAIVFVRTRAACEEVMTDLNTRGIVAAALSGDVAQRERERIIERLRGGTLKVLVATDVAARGLDVDRIGLVVNYDVPRETEAYVHRIGRTGRAGRTGEALTFLTPKEKSNLTQIQRQTGAEITEVKVPTPLDVLRHKASRALGGAAEANLGENLAVYRELVDEFLTEIPMNPVKLAALLLANAIGDDGEESRYESPLTSGKIRHEEHVDEQGRFLWAEFEAGRDKKSAKKGGKSALAPRDEGDFTRYRIEVGHKDRVRPSDIVGAITAEAGIPGGAVGRIDILATFSLVDIAGGLSAEKLRKLANTRIAGRALKIRVDNGPRPREEGKGRSKFGPAKGGAAGKVTGKVAGKVPGAAKGKLQRAGRKAASRKFR